MCFIERDICLYIKYIRLYIYNIYGYIYIYKTYKNIHICISWAKLWGHKDLLDVVPAVMLLPA